MQIGCCLPYKTLMPEFQRQEAPEDAHSVLLNGYKTIMDMGYAYMEATNGSVMELTEAQLADLAERVKCGTFSIRYVNCFLPGTVRICSEPEAAKAHAKETFRRFDKLGIRALVFGSGSCRSYPAGMPQEEGAKHLQSLLRYCAEVGGSYGIYTSLEPLQATETNQINYVSEAVQWVREMDLPYLRVTPDAFHMCVGGEDAAVLSGNMDIINHVHISEAPGRVHPGKLRGDYLPRFMNTLHEIGYDRDVTVECGYVDFQRDLTESLHYIKEVLV